MFIWIGVVITILIIALAIYYYYTWPDDNYVICNFYPQDQDYIISRLNQVVARNQDNNLNYPIQVNLYDIQRYHDLEQIIKEIDRLDPKIKVTVYHELGIGNQYIAWVSNNESVWVVGLDGYL
jgi:hypothetical protein